METKAFEKKGNIRIMHKIQGQIWKKKKSALTENSVKENKEL